jgi:hypothetical protein
VTYLKGIVQELTLKSFFEMKSIKTLLNRIVYIIGLFTTILLVGLILFFIYKKKTNPEDGRFSYADGPYIFYLNDTIIKSVIIEQNSNRNFNISEITLNIRDTNELNHAGKYLPVGFIPFENFQLQGEIQFKAEKIAAISDIHGSLHYFNALLKSNKIIDDSSNWNFGKGHLVIIGDVFDRGTNVTQCLWLIKKLEMQAKENGGDVHLLLGNHEMYILKGNSAPPGIKYDAICSKLLLSYDKLYGTDTYLGKWLRAKSVVIKINKDLFVHGGISEKIVDNQFSLTDINKYFNIWINSEHLLKYKINLRDTISLLTSYFGPLEYRGYFNKNIINSGQSSSFSNQLIDTILKHFNADHIIIGHTVVKCIKEFFENKVIAINNKFPENDILQENSNCQMLIIEGSNYYISGLDGGKILLFSDLDAQKLE